jgi:hypothetical protein
VECSAHRGHRERPYLAAGGPLAGQGLFGCSRRRKGRGRPSLARRARLGIRGAS